LFITDIDLALELGKVDIDPIWVFWPILKESTVLHNLTINRVFKLIRITRPIEYFIFVLRKIYFKISSLLGHIIGVARKKTAKNYS
jgi:hypothetical protein